jgi:hypothetical protein
MRTSSGKPRSWMRRRAGCCSGTERSMQCLNAPTLAVRFRTGEFMNASETRYHGSTVWCKVPGRQLGQTLGALPLALAVNDRANRSHYRVGPIELNVMPSIRNNDQLSFRRQHGESLLLLFVLPGQFRGVLRRIVVACSL